MKLPDRRYPNPHAASCHTPNDGIPVGSEDCAGFTTTKYVCSPSFPEVGNAGCLCCPVPPPTPACTPCSNPESSDCGCICVTQIFRLLCQIVRRYPAATVTVTLEDGTVLTGTPDFPDGICGLLLLTAEGSTTVNAVPLCRIAAVSLTNVAFPNEIGFGPEPCGSCGCEAQCEAAVRAYLPAGTVGVTVFVAGQTVATGTVRGSAEGIILITDAEDVPVYVSTCKIDRIETTAAG